VGSPIANRNRAEIEGLIGFSSIPWLCGLTWATPARELLGRVQSNVRAYAHQDLPSRSWWGIAAERDLNHNPLFQVWFTLQNISMPDVRTLVLTRSTLSPFEIDNTTACSIWLSHRRDRRASVVALSTKQICLQPLRLPEWQNILKRFYGMLLHSLISNLTS